MLWTYLDSERRYRLNVWDNRLAVPNVSLIHDHPWNFTSWILNGKLINERFQEEYGELFEFMTIKCGPGGGPSCLPPAITKLRRLRLDSFGIGDAYYQEASDIHQTMFMTGTVTLNERTVIGDGHHARVFWPAGQRWVDAEPREARVYEIDMALQGVLDTWE